MRRVAAVSCVLGEHSKTACGAHVARTRSAAVAHARAPPALYQSPVSKWTKHASFTSRSRQGRRERRSAAAGGRAGPESRRRATAGAARAPCVALRCWSLAGVRRLLPAGQHAELQDAVEPRDAHRDGERRASRRPQRKLVRTERAPRRPPAHPHHCDRWCGSWRLGLFVTLRGRRRRQGLARAAAAAVLLAPDRARKAALRGPCRARGRAREHQHESHWHGPAKARPLPVSMARTRRRRRRCVHAHTSYALAHSAAARAHGLPRVAIARCFRF